MKRFFLFVIIAFVLFVCFFFLKKLDNPGSKVVEMPKTFGKGEHVTVSGKLKRTLFGDYTAGGYKFELNPRLYWSCIDKSKSKDEIINMGDYVNSYLFYMRESINVNELTVLLDKKSKDNGWVQVTGDLDKKKHLFTTTKAVLIYDCPKD